MLKITVSKDSLSPPVAFSIKAKSSSFGMFFMVFTSYIVLDNGKTAV